MNEESRMTNDEGSSKRRLTKSCRHICRYSDTVILSLFVIRVSSFLS
jgi:hypothetical protein